LIDFLFHPASLEQLAVLAGLSRRRSGVRIPYEAPLFFFFFNPQPTHTEVDMLGIKDMVKDNRLVTFVHFKDGELLYRTECGFEFPVPVSDVGTATMLAQDKALLFMRYIRKHMDLLAQARAEAVQAA
jgi:hypothetical protein